MDPRLLSAAGIIAGGTYAAGDVLLFGRAAGTSSATESVPRSITEKEGNDANIWWVFPHSARRLRAGALAGVIAAPFWFAGTAGVYHSLRGGRRAAPLAVAAATFAVAGHSMASFIHASFYPYGAAYQLAQQLEDEGANPTEVDKVAQHAREIGRTTEVAYPIYGALQAVSSLLIATEILRGKTDYPRWAAVVVPPLVPAAIAIAATGTPQLKQSRLSHLRGAGLSLGWITSYLAASVLRRRS